MITLLCMPISKNRSTEGNIAHVIFGERWATRGMVALRYKPGWQAAGVQFWRFFLGGKVIAARMC